MNIPMELRWATSSYCAPAAGTGGLHLSFRPSGGLPPEAGVPRDSSPVKPKHSARIQARNQWGKVSPFPSCKCLLLVLVSTAESKLMTYSRFSMWVGGQYRQAPTPTQNQAQRNPKGLKSRPNSLLGKLFGFFLIPLGRHLPSLYPQSTPHI